LHCFKTVAAFLQKTDIRLFNLNQKIMTEASVLKRRSNLLNYIEQNPAMPGSNALSQVVIVSSQGRRMSFLED